jgi:RecA-family ATPase
LEDHRYLLDALAAIDPATLGYQEWVDVGMALHESGYSWTDWDSWSQRDHARYHAGECEHKWSGFGNGDDRVKSGTIIHMAEMRGWHQPTSGLGDALDWSGMGMVTAGPDATMAESDWFDDSDTGEWEPCRQLADWLGALFDDDDYVCLTMHSYNEGTDQEPQWKPKGGDSSRTAGEIRRELLKSNATMDKVVGDWEEAAGAWACFNPLRGDAGGKRSNANIIDYRYALVESDRLDLDKQLPAIRDLHLPCAAVVSSGGKSVHAIVKVDAKDKDEYKKRVEWLYGYCNRHGFDCDIQNKNPSRLTRIPGVTRGGRRQLLLATDIGESDWESWKKWAEESEDDLPDEVVGGIGTPARLKPMLIGLTDDDCILRQMAKMILVGDSKMGKSFTLIDLAEAICVGGDWLGMQCAQGKVYYINMELEQEEFRDRQNAVWNKRPESCEDGMIDLINANFIHMPMRGKASDLWDIKNLVIRRVLRYGPPGTFAAIIIDPIYKVNGGDDNDAKAVARFTNTLDSIIQECGCSVIYAHHHPKGATGNRRAIDRMSGSGVYGRDADTVVDFSPLFCPDEDLRKRWEYAPMFRAEIKCRSFGYRKPIDTVFVHPRFIRDTDGKLAHLKILGEDKTEEGRYSGGQTTQQRAKSDWDRKREAITDAYNRYPSELDRDDDCARDFSELYDIINWGAFGLGTKTFAEDTVRGWFGAKGKLNQSYRIGSLQTKMGIINDCLVPVENNKESN